MGGGAWPFLVGGLPCQVDSGNERDLSLLNSTGFSEGRALLRGTIGALPGGSVRQ